MGARGPSVWVRRPRAREFQVTHLAKKYLLSICLGPMLGTRDLAVDRLDTGSASEDPI